MIKKCLMITIYLVLGYQAKGFYFIEPMMERAPASFKELASTETKKVKKEKPAEPKNSRTSVYDFGTFAFDLSYYYEFGYSQIITNFNLDKIKSIISII